MLPRNVLAIRKTLGTFTEILTSTTPKSSQVMLMDYPAGSYTGMRTVNKIGILDFSMHTARLANSLRQIQFLGTTAAEDRTVTSGLASLRQDDVMKKETTNLVRTGLLHYYRQLKEDLSRNASTAAAGEEVKVTVLCTWDPEVGAVYCSIPMSTRSSSCLLMKDLIDETRANSRFSLLISNRSKIQLRLGAQSKSRDPHGSKRQPRIRSGLGRSSFLNCVSTGHYPSPY